MHLKDVVLTGIAVLVLTLRSLGAPAQAFEGEALLAPANAALEVPLDGEGELALADVLAGFQQVTDWTLLMSDETRRLVQQTTLHASGPLRAEPARVTAAVEAVLASGGFVWTLVRDEPPRLMSVRSLDTNARTSTREDAIFVPAEEIARFADHPALLVETLVTLPHTDVRTLSNSMRGMVVDPNLLQIAPMGNSNELLLQGTGRSVAEIVSMLSTVDAQSAPDGKATASAGRAPRILQAKSDVTLSGDEESSLSLLELVDRYAEATGQTALVRDEAARLLELDEIGLESALTVSAAAFPTLFEELLFEHRFALVEVLEDPALFAVQSLDTSMRPDLGQHARVVDAGSIAACAARPATVFWTVLELPHTDVRTLSNTLRGIIEDPNLMQIVPVGNSGSLILTGFGRQLVRLNEMLTSLDAAAAARPAVVPAPAPAAEGGGK